jgi:hypothetical protein
MTSIPDKIQELEQKLEYLQNCHEFLVDQHLKQGTSLTRYIFELEGKIKQLSSRLSEFDGIEKVALDAYLASSQDAQNTLAAIDDVLPLEFQHLSLHRLATMRELRQDRMARRRDT